MEQIVVVPEIVPGVDGIVFTIIAKVSGVDEPHALFAVTVIFPLVADAVVLMEFVVDVPDHPPGNVQVYEVAEGSLVTEYVLLDPEQIVVVPEIVPGVEGMVFTVIANVCGVDDPQALFAVTVIFPLVELAVVFIEFVVDVPVQPPGNVQVYEVAEGSLVTEYVLLLPPHIVVSPEIVPGWEEAVH